MTEEPHYSCTRHHCSEGKPDECWAKWTPELGDGQQAPTPIAPGDYVQPITDIEGTDVTGKMTPCKVTAVYKNGNIHAVSDDGKVSWHGEAVGFRKVGHGHGWLE